MLNTPVIGLMTDGTKSTTNERGGPSKKVLSAEIGFKGETDRRCSGG